MKSFNRVQLVGWLGKDISIKKAKDGTPYANFRMSTNNLHKNTDGNTVMKTNWHTVWIWDNDIIERYKDNLITGSHVMVEGVLNYRDYTDKDGKFNHVAEIKVSSLVDLDR